MTELNQIYKCKVCGNIVAVEHASGGELACCGEPMQLLRENTEDAALEKHVPVIEKTATGIKVKVGAVPHPMDADHYIEWVEVLADGKSYFHYLQPNDSSETEFQIVAESFTARIYCNLHGLWKS